MATNDIDVNTIHTGDSLEVLPTLPAESVHCCMTSPPYWNLRDYDHNDQLGLEPDSDDYVSNIADVLDEVKRVLRPDGSLWLNLGDTYSDKDLQQIPARVALELQRRGWILRNRVTWAKPNPMPQSVKDRLNDTTEAVFHFVKDRSYWYDLDAIRNPYAGSSIDRAESESPIKPTPEKYRNEVHAQGGGINEDMDLHPSGKNPGDVFEVTTKPSPEAHFAVYPPELCEKPIKATVPPKICPDCGSPHGRVVEDVSIHKQNEKDVSRPQTRKAIKKIKNSDLTDEHIKAAEKRGWDNNGAEQTYRRGNDERVKKLAQEVKAVLGSYFNEIPNRTSTQTKGWTATCDCGTDATESGIILDPFAGAGTTLLKAKELGRKFVGVELNPEYADMARARVGLSPDDPSNVREDDKQNGLEAY